MIVSESEIKKEIIRWDVINWSKALDFWRENVELKGKKYQCLELGASFGGLSLWLALGENYVVCTDVDGPEPDARLIHAKYNCQQNITYHAMDATNIPYESFFDIVTFKSILGGISANRNDNKKKVADEIYKALKPGGKLLFAENLEGCFLHKALRRKFGTKGWNYLQIDELNEVFSSYKSIKYKSIGFLGCMGRNEKQRSVFGKVDTVLDNILPQRSKYILVGVAVK
ncbi:class I SAM-dependent methyltransferase [Pedobacter sp. SYSU D00535]|uniref:class I SAM-dependent methyltransferase n=1 Tax=Pedobacter sp. SYSU D00535 TaxID=2810308 RepID=UPI001A974AAE|nr:class I SAM-dependent methyltransferase [Pedobacter sp. SYSU D00535]